MDKQIKLKTPGLGMGGRVKAQVLADGQVIKETEWSHNLILTAGMDRVPTVLLCELFRYCCIGTGNTPTDDDSGAVTATTSGTTCTSSAGFFAAGDVNKLLRFDTGEKALITAFTNTTTVTLGATLGVVGATLFTMYRVTQTGLATETKRSGTYLTGSGNCQSSRSGAIFTHRRTYEFTAEVGNVNYAEVGFSNNVSAGANLNMRALFTGGAVTVLTGQQMRVIYDFTVTVTPTTPRAIEPTITGWPALQQSVTFDSTTDKVTLASHGFSTNTKIKFAGSVAPGGITFGTQYYVITDTSSTFKVTATLSGGAIDITSNGTSVVLTTNVVGSEQMTKVGLSQINSSNGLTEAADSNGGGSNYTNEPAGVVAGAVGMVISAASTALPTWPDSGNIACTAVTNGGKTTLTADTYTNGNFFCTRSTIYATTDANASNIRSFNLTVSSFGARAGLTYLFDFNQEKTSLFTLTIVWKYTWDRAFA